MMEAIISKVVKAYIDAADALKANLASPTFTGTPAAPTAAPATNTTQIATTAFVLANSGGTAALQADQETATSTTTFVSPGRQQHHPSAAKAWVRCGVTGNDLASFNVTSVTDTGTGIATVNWNVDFSSANYSCVASPHTGSGYFCNVSAAPAAGSCAINCWTIAAALVDPTGYSAAAFGDQ